MSSSNHYLALLIPAFKAHADKPIIRPSLGPPYDAWDQVSFREWEEQLAFLSVRWGAVLHAKNVHPGDVVGVWLSGRKWTDLLHISSLCAAGFVPQLFSQVFSPEMICALLTLSGGKALIFDEEEFPDIAEEYSIPTTPSVGEDALKRLHAGTKALLASTPRMGRLREQDLPRVAERGPAVIFHSSGTTSGMPKLIPTSHLLMKTFMLHKFPDCLLGGDFDIPSNVFNSLGNLAHVGTFQAFHGAAMRGCCTVQSSSMAMGPDEMVNMVRECGLNRLVQYGTFVSVHIRAAEQNDNVKRALQGFRQILYTGVALNTEHARWAEENKLKLTSMYGTSETAPLLISKLDQPHPRHIMRPCAGASPVFVPYTPPDAPRAASAHYTPAHRAPAANGHARPNGPASSTTEASPAPARPQLYEIVVAPDAPDAPPAALFGPDGLWHTQDLFERVALPPRAAAPSTAARQETAQAEAEAEAVGWVHRGRAGDWIKTSPGFVDTKAIEDAVRRTCGDLVSDALVAGSSRAHPVLLVELPDAAPVATADGAPDDVDAPDDTDSHMDQNLYSGTDAARALAAEIVRRLAGACAPLFPYERIARAEWVLVLPRGSLVRNKEKGNVRRGATEERFREQIDRMYA